MEKDYGDLRVHRIAVLSAADEAYSGLGALPPGTMGRLHTAIDALRSSDDSISIQFSERIALTLHQLQAHLHRANRDVLTIRGLRLRIRKVADHWVRSMPVWQLYDNSICQRS